MNISRLMRQLIWLVGSRVEETGAQYKALGFFGGINFPIYHLIWIYASKQAYENLPLRLIATFLCFSVALHDFWPKRLQVYLPLYWYFTLLYCLPFFFVFMLIENHGSAMWITNTIAIFFFLLLLVDWISCLILLAIGIFFGILIACITSGIGILYFGPSFDYTGFFITYFAATAIGALFVRNNEKIKQEKIETLITVGESIAHELRTPLKTIKSGASGLQKYLPELLETYQIAERGGLEIPEIEDLHYEILSRTLDNISSEVNFSWTFIDLLLVNANQGVGARPYQACSMQHCVTEALQRYPYDSNEESMIHFEGGDFTFLGDRELMIHIFFNLLKNALYYIKVAGKGRVTISLASHKNNNVLYFKDTAKGISKKALPHVFDRFFSETFHGTGIGLAFCKLVMQNFGGSIACRSEEGEYAEFMLTFPVFQKVISDQ